MRSGCVAAGDGVEAAPQQARARPPAQVDQHAAGSGTSISADDARASCVNAENPGPVMAVHVHDRKPGARHRVLVHHQRGPRPRTLRRSAPSRSATAPLRAAPAGPETDWGPRAAATRQPRRAPPHRPPARSAAWHVLPTGFRRSAAISRILCRRATVARKRAGDDHSSSPAVSGGIEQPTRKPRADHPQALPYLVLLRAGFGLPPALQRARCALTAPFHPYRPPPCGRGRRYVFCATFLQVTLTGRYPAHCPLEFGLSSPRPRRGACARRSSGRLRRNVKEPGFPTVARGPSRPLPGE